MYTVEFSKKILLPSYLQSFPGGYLINLLQMSLNQEDFISACNDIFNQVFEAILDVVNPVFRDEIATLFENNKDKQALDLLAGLLATDSIYLTVVKNAIEVGVMGFVPLKKVQEYQHDMVQISKQIIS